MKNIIVVNPKSLERKVEAFSKDGKEKVHVLADFDRTLTKCFVRGEKIRSIMAILRNEGFLDEEYSEKAHALADKYHPIEVDPSISMKEKKKKMKEWWNTHNKLLVEKGLNKRAIQKVVDSGKIKLRNGTKKLFKILKREKVPLVIMSSSGLGDAIPLFLKRQRILYNNVHIITNLFEFDRNGIAVKQPKRVIHVMNKDETAVRDFPCYSLVRDRRNVILLGDSLGDPGMIEGFDYNNVVKVGFLNEEVKKQLSAYKKSFDVLLTNDTEMTYVNNLLERILK